MIYNLQGRGLWSWSECCTDSDLSLALNSLITYFRVVIATHYRDVFWGRRWELPGRWGRGGRAGRHDGGAHHGGAQGCLQVLFLLFSLKKLKFLGCNFFLEMTEMWYSLLQAFGINQNPKGLTAWFYFIHFLNFPNSEIFQGKYCLCTYIYIRDSVITDHISMTLLVMTWAGSPESHGSNRTHNAWQTRPPSPLMT